MNIHPAAEIFPSMTTEEYEALKTSIREHGLLVPITVCDEKILDGRNRYKVCRELDIEPQFTEYTGDDPVEFVWMMNFSRRHLDTTGKAFAAAAKADMRQGARTDLVQNCTKSIPEAAEQAGVSVRTVKHARKVLSDGIPDLVKIAKAGEIAVSEAAQIAALPPERQYEIVGLPKKERKQKIKVEQERAKLEEESKSDAPFVLNSKTAKVIEPYYTIDTWNKLPKPERQKIIDAGFESKAKMTAQEGDSIEWARHSLNTVTGCRHGCPYCYARDIAERYFEAKFEPVFYPSRLSAPSNHKIPEEAVSDPSFKNVFANSMSDLFGKWMPAQWIEATIEMARRNPKWNFLVLTKFPQRAIEFEFPDNWWMGTTVDVQSRVENAEKAFEKIQCKTKWLSCEPLLEPLRFSKLDTFQWVVIGGASRSNKTPKWEPPFDWISSLHQQARAAHCGVYHKSNCGLSTEMRVREFPWVKSETKRLPKEFKSKTA